MHPVGGLRSGGSRIAVHKIARGSAVSKGGRAVAIGVVLGILPLLAIAIALAQGTRLATDMPALAIGALLLVLIGGFVWLNLPGTVKLGRDGVVVDDRSRRRPRFIAFSDIESAERYDERVFGKDLTGIVLGLRGGEQVRLPFGEDQFGASEKLAALLAQILGGVDAQRREPGDDDASHLRRHGRDAEGWLADLRRIGAEADAGPRQAPIATERLWRIVESTTHGSAVRAAAAVALGPRIDVQGTERLTRIAEESASPGLRAALDGVARADEAATLAALGELEAAEADPVAGTRSA